MIEKKQETILKIDELAQKLYDTCFFATQDEIYELKNICEFIPGYSYKGEELKDSSTGMISIKCVERDNGFRKEGIKSLLPLKKLPNQKKCEIDDILVCHTDLTKNQDIIGRPIIIPTKGSFSSLTYSMDLVKVNPTDRRFSKALIYRILNSANFKKHALGFCSGTTVVHLSKNALQSYKFNGPKSDFELLSKRLQVLQNEITTFTGEIEVLEYQKQLLLLKYFS